MIFAKTHTYTFEEFKNLQLKKEVNKVENLLKQVINNKVLCRSLVSITCIMLMSGYFNEVSAYMADVNQAINKLNKLGNQLLGLVRAIGYWVVLLITSKDCIAQAINGDKKGVGGAVTKGLMIMAVIYFLPELFDMMKSMVEQ